MPAFLANLVRLRSRPLGLLLFAFASTASDTFPEFHPTPEPDTVYLQEVGRQVNSTLPLTTVASFRGSVYAGTEKGLLLLHNGEWSEVAGLREPIHRMVSINSNLWVAAGSGFFRFDGNWRKISDLSVSDLCLHHGDLIAAVGSQLSKVTGEHLEPIGTASSPFPLQRVLSHQDLLYVQGSDRLTTFDGSVFGGRDEYGFPADDSWDWGQPPARMLRDLATVGSRLIVATDRGLGVLRGMSMTPVRGDQGLPFEDVLCLAPGWEGDLWVGTSRGAIRQTGSQFHYFAGHRWLPDDRVHSIAVAGRTVYVATDKGLGIIDYQPFTLAKKAAYYERELIEWGHKRLGLIQKLEWDESLQEFVRESGDNDGGYSGDYLVAESYRYAVTHDETARIEATNTFHALRWLRTMTRIPGFIARGVWVKGEKGHKATGGSGGYPAEWHDVVGGQFEWKGDTSSDELCSHFYATTRFLELAAQGDEIRQGCEHLAQMATHLIGHGWQLIDLDGKPTRWGRWDPEYFKTDEGHFDRGLQCLELLSFIKTAETLTGDPRFGAAYQRLVDLGYPAHTLRQRKTFPPESVAHFEDQLAFWSYWNLLRYERDPGRRALYRRSFERTYEMLRVENQPWYNYMHQVISGDDEESAASIAHLREWPLDLRIWSYQNSHRADLKTPSGYKTFLGGIRSFSPREREPMRWDAWTMQADGGTDGRDVVEPSSWLLAYWMGRYHGLIAAPTATDPALLTVEHSLNPELGAKPYAGPPRPPVP